MTITGRIAISKWVNVFLVKNNNYVAPFVYFCIWDHKRNCIRKTEQMLHLNLMLHY